MPQRTLALSDGAILDPVAETWRAVAPAPIPFVYASTAVVGEDVYFLLDGDSGLGGSRAALLRYSLGEDRWDELPRPSGDDGLYGLVAAGEELVAFAGTDEGGDRPDQVFNPDTSEWTVMAADPLSPSSYRTMVWAEPFLYLFDKEQIPDPGVVPYLTRVARYDLGTGLWERLPDSEILGAESWYAEGNLIVNPQLGGADGGEVNNYGRTYPYGGILDTDAGSWVDLPDAPSELSNGVFGGSGGRYYSGGREGLVLDLAAMRWVEMPAAPGVGYEPYVERVVVAAGPAAVAFGGQDWTTQAGEVLGDAWIWRPPAAESSTQTTSSSATPSTSGVSDGEVTDADLVASCGQVEFETVPADLSGLEPADDVWNDIDRTEDGMGDGFFDSYEWSVVSQTDQELALFGSLPEANGDGFQYVSAIFEKTTDGKWKPSNWGDCRIELTAPGFGPAGFVLDPDHEPDPAATSIAVLATEHACASGRVPDARDVTSVIVAEDAASVSIVVLVKTSSAASETCEGNPPFSFEVELGSPLGDRAVLDGGVQPALARPWPPTESSLESMGRSE